MPVDRASGLYAETFALLGQLGYDVGTFAPRRTGEYGFSDGMREFKWAKPDHWERVEAAMRLDESETERQSAKPDIVNHPPHYTSDPSGVECIAITRHRNFNVGNAIKYLWRAGLKADAEQAPLAKQIEDLERLVGTSLTR